MGNPNPKKSKNQNPKKSKNPRNPNLNPKSDYFFDF
jgi:hypothetical protein